MSKYTANTFNMFHDYYQIIEKDNGIRTTSIEAMVKLKPAFDQVRILT